MPGVKLDENGLCNLCLRQAQEKDPSGQRQRLEQKFLGLQSRLKGSGAYDCLVAYSGGKDSTYTLHLLREYGLKILAFSFDNWFQSEQAHKNIKTVIAAMNIDHVTVHPAYETFVALMRSCVVEGLYSKKMMERASAVCTTCLSLIRFQAFKMAIEKSIPFVVFGLSPGQAPLATAVFKTNPEMISKMQDSIYEPLQGVMEHKIDGWFLSEWHLQNKEHFPYSVNPLAFQEYSEEKIFHVAESYGWQRPEDTDANSTNCLLNVWANEVHRKTYGFNPYAFEVATLIRQGSMSRQEGLRRLNQEADPEMLAWVRNRLGVG